MRVAVVLLFNINFNLEYYSIIGLVYYMFMLYAPISRDIVLIENVSTKLTSWDLLFPVFSALNKLNIL